MTIDIPGKKIFVQRDVRETPAATATATSVGLTDPHYVTLQVDADLTNERVLTMGEGLNMTDAGPGLTLTINGENATDTNKGISTFQLADFTVTSGNVVLKNDVARTFDGDTGTATTSLGNVDILGGDGITTVGAANDVTITNSDHSDVGLANTHRGLTNEHLDWTADLGATNIHAGNYTNTGDTTYTADEVDLTLTGTVFSLKNKTSYWSCSGLGFRAMYTATDTQICRHDTADTYLTSVGDDPYLMAQINIPNGAVITGAVVYGADATNTWVLRRTIITNKTTSDMANAVVNTEDTTITNGIIDNSLYSYWIYVLTGLNDKIYGARITYTTDYI